MPTLEWNPKHTRAFIVSIARFKGRKEPDFSIDDRLDPALVETLKKRGVPAGQITHLQDQAATTENLRAQFLEWFDLDHLGRSAAQFDEAKLRWVNAQHMKAMADEAQPAW